MLFHLHARRGNYNLTVASSVGLSVTAFTLGYTYQATSEADTLITASSLTVFERNTIKDIIQI